jgi:hypothetical protein
MVSNAIALVEKYINQSYTNKELRLINSEFQLLFGEEIPTTGLLNNFDTYEQVQEQLSSLNEKESFRKRKGVYYTPADLVKFILINSFKLVTGKLKSNNLHVMDLNGIPYYKICFRKTVFDPTCGSGEFLLSAMETKFDLLDLHYENVTKSKVHSVIKTINGNDINSESTTISKIRLFLSVLHRFGTKKIIGVAGILNDTFQNYDYITKKKENEKYDIIIGNPPYVEDSKSELNPEIKYGNIYANVLENASDQLNDDGVLGFVIPLSYVATPRMKNIRERLYKNVPEQYLLNYSDRPDCLFTSVHQKLSILFARKININRSIYTSNYHYWYKKERQDLFKTATTIKNEFIEENFIPKIGTELDSNIYKKIIGQPTKISQMFSGGEYAVNVNMRASFWIKAFLHEHDGAEYKSMQTGNRELMYYTMCLFNSSLFWWYWICVSDGWHITNKELDNFRVPNVTEFSDLVKLSQNLENKLEQTKVYVGTKQTQYEYKHRLCINEIHAIDDYINKLFGLTKVESKHIKNFAYRYRVSGGVSA